MPRWVVTFPPVATTLIQPKRDEVKPDEALKVSPEALEAIRSISLSTGLPQKRVVSVLVRCHKAIPVRKFEEEVRAERERAVQEDRRRAG